MGSLTPFRFKQFSVHHDRCAMKVGTDGVLLGALAGRENPKRILEIGVGSGVVSLMLAQRFPEAMITGVEIDAEAWNQAAENAKSSPWSDRIEFFNLSFQEFSRSSVQKFDLIISNPPYFSNHLKSNDSQKNLALHGDGLSFSEMVFGIKDLIFPESEIWVILPPVQMDDFEKKMEASGINLFHKEIVKDQPSKKILRIISGFSLNNQPFTQRSISLKNPDGSFSSEYSDLLKNFLLIF
jgi:tRNA1Val (adenine37-N6)-methyltransferase